MAPRYPTLSRLQRAFRKIRKPQSGWLDESDKVTGLTDGTILTGIPGMIYVRDPQNGQVLTVYNSVAPTDRANLPVKVGRLVGESIYRVKGMRDSYGVPSGGSSGSEHSHENLFISRERFLPFIVLPISGGGHVVQIYGDVIIKEDGSFGWISHQTLDLSGDVPTDGTAKYVLIEADDDGVINVVDGTPVAAKELLTPANIPAHTDGSKPSCAVRLFDGQTQLYRDPNSINDFVDVRSLTSGGGGGGSGLPNPFALPADLTPAALTGDVNDYNTTGLSTTDVLRLDAGGSDRNITGIAGGTDGRILIIQNISTAKNLKLIYESTSSAEANRFKTNGNITIRPSRMATIIYDATISRWRILASLQADSLQGAPIAGGLYSTIQNNDLIRFNLGDDAFERTTPAEVADIALGTVGTSLTELQDLTDGEETVLHSHAGDGGYIQENSAQLLYVGAQAYSVLPGSAVVNGQLLTWGSNIARTGLSLTANTMYYVYLYNNSGTPAVEESTTVPVWDSALNCYKKTGDDTRRCIGFIQASATNTIRKFVNTVWGRVSEIWYMDGVDPGSGGKRPVSAGTTTGSWASFSLAPIVPVHATHFGTIAKVGFPSAGDDGILGLSPISLGSSIASMSPHAVRDRGGAAGAITFFGLTWLSIVESQTYYYRLQIIAGSPNVYIDVHGARFIR